jgi:hypothetical protein
MSATDLLLNALLDILNLIFFFCYCYYLILLSWSQFYRASLNYYELGFDRASPIKYYVSIVLSRLTCRASLHHFSMICLYWLGLPYTFYILTQSGILFFCFLLVSKGFLIYRCMQSSILISYFELVIGLP